MGQIRITGGTHRSRKIIVDDQPGLRPTADRVRETLFNWLGHNLSGMAVLDLYTGSGMLALEAASRQAASVVCVDNNPKVIQQLKNNLNVLGFDTIQVVQSTAKAFCENTSSSFDLIFLDPPFDGSEMAAISDIITPLAEVGGCVYREYGASQMMTPMNEQFWTPLKTKKAGQVIFELWQKRQVNNE